MFNVRQIIIYTTYGICKIDSLIQKDFNGQTFDYYVLKPLNNDKTSLLVQVNNPITLSKLKQLLSKDEALELIQSIPQIDSTWIENDNERKRVFTDIIRNGERKKIISIIKSVYNHQKILKEKGRKLHSIDDQFYKDAEKIIYDELSYVLEIDKADVIGFITNTLEAN